MKKQVKISELITDKITGEWGDEANGEDGINVLRTTNFTNHGLLNFNNVVKRAIKAELIEKKKLLKGDVIIEKSGGSPAQPVGRVVYFDRVDEVFVCNNFTAVLRPSERVHPKYFFYALFYLHLSKRTLRYQNKTTGILNLKLERYLEEEKIPLPDIQTQKQIASILEDADRARQQRKVANKLTEQFLQSSFFHLFGDPVTNEKGWDVETLVECVIMKGGGTPDTSNDDYYDGNIPWVSPKDMKSRFISTSIDKITEKAIKESSAKLIGSNNVLLVVRSGILKKTLPIGINICPVAINQDMKALKCKDFINPFFLAFQLEAMSQKILQNVRGTTADNISSDDLKAIKIIIPPLPMQEHFAFIVADAEALRQKQQQSERELEHLFQSLLQQYFGERDAITFQAGVEVLSQAAEPEMQYAARESD